MDQSRESPMIFDRAMGNWTCACADRNSDCLRSTNDPGYTCQCRMGFKGNPCLNEGCKDMDDCKEAVINCFSTRAKLGIVGMLSCLTALSMSVIIYFQVLYYLQTGNTESPKKSPAKMRMEKTCGRFVTSEKTDKITALGRGCNGILILMMVLWQAHVVIGGDAPLTKPHCRSKCGELNISYPFGLYGDREDCYLIGFDLTCDNTTDPPKTYWDPNLIQVIDIRWESSEVIFFTNVTTTYECYGRNGSSDNSISWGWIAEHNIKFSYTKNVYTAIGCDTYAYLRGILVGNGSHDFIISSERNKSSLHNYTTGCMSICENKESILEGSCSGMGCCQTSIPPGFKFYSSYLRSDNNHSSILDFNPCSYSFLVEKNNYTFNKNDLTYMDKQRWFPIVMDWSVGNQTCEIAQKNSNYLCASKNSYCLNSTSGYGYICKCSHGYQGNPYLHNGCQDIDECQRPDIYFCKGTCINILGSYNCTCPLGTIGDAKKYGCFPVPRNSQIRLVILLPVTIGCGLVFVLFIVCAIFIFKMIKQRREVIQRKRHFLENHGLLLEHLLSSSDDNATNTKIFTMKEMMKATDNFDDARIVGCGGHGVVYKGILSDLRIVAIKKSKRVLKSEIEEFVNEVALLSQMNHRNIVKLFGCCLESEVPLLVYEFISNGTLSDRMHVWNHDQFHLPWEERLRIASEVAGAVAYLHFSTSRSIFHRDLKSANILLDDKLTAKVSDFGTSKFVMADQTHVTTVVQGTFGYLDPEYFQTGKLTDKSDVYSFGVTLVELLTGEKPSSISVSREGRSLISHFIWAMSEKKMFQVIEPSLVNEDTRKELQVVSELAEACLKLRGEDRPTMKDVEVILNGLRKKTKRNQEVVNKEPSSL